MKKIKDAWDAMRHIDLHKSKKIFPLTVDQRENHVFIIIKNDEGVYAEIKVYESKDEFERGEE